VEYKPKPDAARVTPERYRVVLYCPDTHLAHHGRTDEEKGVGGGVSARIGLMRALARLGHEVTAYVNCDAPGEYDGVRYEHFKRVKKIETDILIATSSGGRLDLRPLTKVDVRARIRTGWLHAIPCPRGIERLNLDWVYVVSNFLRDRVVTSGDIEPQRIFVLYNGIESSWYTPLWRSPPERDPYRIAYVGHPSKGLRFARKIIEILRRLNPRYQLHVFGAASLHGQTDSECPEGGDGIVMHGVVGQRDLVRQLFQCGFALFIQDVPEHFGIALIQAKYAGAIPIASSVGAFPELIRHGWDGLIASGDPGDAATHEQVAKWIQVMIETPDYTHWLRSNAMNPFWDWDRTARTLTVHWNDHLQGYEDRTDSLTIPCPHCERSMAQYPDGFRCFGCGRFYPWPQGLTFVEGAADMHRLRDQLRELEIAFERVRNQYAFNVRELELITSSRGYRILKTYWSLKDKLRRLLGR